MFLPFDLYYETLLTRRARLLIEPEYLPKLSFDILGACEGLANKLAGMAWPTNQSFYSKPILGIVGARVCSLVYRFRANENDPDA